MSLVLGIEEIATMMWQGSSSQWGCEQLGSVIMVMWSGGSPSSQSLCLDEFIIAPICSSNLSIHSSQDGSRRW